MYKKTSQVWNFNFVPNDPHPPLKLAKVIKLDRGYPLCLLEDNSTIRAEHAISLVKSDLEMRASVGDWVSLEIPDEHDKALIQHIYPRKSALVRWDSCGRTGSRGANQVLAANIDTVFITISLSPKKLSTARLIRALVVVADSGAKPVVLLTKTDLKKTEKALTKDIEIAQRAVGSHVNVIAISNIDGSGIEAVKRELKPGEVGILLGESGVGKSSIINELLGKDLLEIGEVRDKDGAGRHTTVARQMIKLSNSSYIIDAPGLRSFPMVGHEEGLDRAYPEIASLSGMCKFRDCTHTNEPKCAVQNAINNGEIDSVRAEDYKNLSQELRESRKKLEKF